MYQTLEGEDGQLDGNGKATPGKGDKKLGQQGDVKMEAMVSTNLVPGTSVKLNTLQKSPTLPPGSGIGFTPTPKKDSDPPVDMMTKSYLKMERRNTRFKMATINASEATESAQNPGSLPSAHPNKFSGAVTTSEGTSDPQNLKVDLFLDDLVSNNR